MARRNMDAKSASRPWGKWRILLETPSHKVKRIAVRPGHRLSYQSHSRRQEHWTVVQGEALVTLDGKELRLGVGRCAVIPKGSAHRVENPGAQELVFIEVQTGDYFGEDDIIRHEDDYGRTGKERA